MSQVKHRAKQLSESVGFALLIKRTLEDKSVKVDRLFRTRFEAETFQREHFRSVAKWSIKGVRVNIVPLQGPKERLK